MSSYLGYHAQLYDTFYQDKDYVAESQFIHHLIGQYQHPPGKNILELACGTGNHALALEALGYHLTATDYSPDMLSVAKQKAKAQSSTIDFKLADMRELPPFPKPFDVCLCLFDSIGYTITNDAIQTVLRGVHDNLNLGGLFICEFWHAAAMLKWYEPHRDRDFETSDGRKIHRMSDTTLNIKNQTATVAYVIDEKNAGKSLHHLEESQQNRFFQVQEMKLFLTSSGFELLACYNGYQPKETIDDHTWHVVSIARKIT